jgi:hypothetical protein
VLNLLSRLTFVSVTLLSVGKPRKRLLDDVENDLKKMDVRGWGKTAKDRNEWKLILKEARVLH